MSEDYFIKTPLRTVVSYFLDECDLSNDAFDKAWVISFRGLGLMNQEMAAQPITERIPVDGNKTAKIPKGCIKWTKIGIMDEKGQVSTLRINNGLTTFADANPSRLSELTSDIASGFPSVVASPWFFNYYSNGGYAPLFGIAPSFVQFGEIRVDETNRVVILNPDFQYSSILFEYICVPEKNGDYEVPTCLVEPIISFLKWKFKKGTREDFYGDMTVARRALPKKSVSLQGIHQAIRQDSGMYLKV